jgi:hypothetical protein
LGWGLKVTENVFEVQKKCLRVNKGVNKRVSCRSIVGEPEMLTVTSLYIVEILCFIIKNKICRTRYSDIHSCNTIHKYNLYVQLCDSDHCNKSVISMGVKVFNSLPLELKSNDNFKVFNRKLKNCLFHIALYCLQEFFFN